MNPWEGSEKDEVRVRMEVVQRENFRQERKEFHVMNWYPRVTNICINKGSLLEQYAWTSWLSLFSFLEILMSNFLFCICVLFKWGCQKYDPEMDKRHYGLEVIKQRVVNVSSSTRKTLEDWKITKIIQRKKTFTMTSD